MAAVAVGAFVILPIAVVAGGGYLIYRHTTRAPVLDALPVEQPPFQIPPDAWFSGTWIVAPPNSGKTTLLQFLACSDFSEDASVILFDSKGELIDSLKRLAFIKDRLILVEPVEDAAFALNPLDISHTTATHAAALLEYVMAGLLDAKFTAMQSSLFRNVVPAIVEAYPNPTLETFKQVMLTGLRDTSKLSPHARQFFENKQAGFDSKTYDDRRKEVYWRLDYLLSNPVLRTMFSAPHTKLDLGREMDRGAIIMIDANKSILGDDGAEFFQRFFIALIARAAQQRAGRPQQAKKPCYVYIDECQTCIAKDTKIPIILDECRSQKIGLLLAHQRVDQIKNADVLSALANCAIRMANSDDDARYLADKFRLTTDEMRGHPQGTFVTFVRGATPKGFPLRVEKLDLDSFPKMSDAEWDAVKDRMRVQYSYTPEPEAAVRYPPSSAEGSGRPRSKRSEDPGEPAPKWGK